MVEANMRSIGAPRKPSTGALPGLRRADRIDSGPPIRARVRLLATLAFAFTLPVLALSVIRADAADAAARRFREGNTTAQQFHFLELAVERARSALVRFEAQPEVETEESVTSALDTVSRAILDLGDAPALPEGQRHVLELKTTTRRVRAAIDEAVRRKGGALDSMLVRRANLALETLARLAGGHGDSARKLTTEEALVSSTLVSHVARDQLVLGLVLFFAALGLIGLGPQWALTPLLKLRSVAKRVQQGRVREVIADGDDEVAEVARALGASLRELEDLERKRAGKISEMQNVLHSLMDRLEEAVIVVGDDRKIDYISKGAAELLGKRMHNLRNERFDEVVFAPALHAAVEQASLGDVAEGELRVSLEAEDGRVTPLRAYLGLVSDREGSIARVLAVMRP